MKVVQIGTGGWGKHHTRILSKLGVLSAVCDADSRRSKEYGEKYSVNHYESLDDLISSEEFDVAFVVTPTSTHMKIAVKLLEAKKHVFVEKPLAKTSNQIEKLIEIANRNKLCLFVGYVFLYNEIFKKIKAIHKTESIKYANFEWKKLGTFDEDIFHNLLSHDLSLNLELFGMPKKITANSKYGVLTDVDRFSLELLFGKTVKSEITIDRISHLKKKTVMVLTQKNSYIWDDDILFKFNKNTKKYKKSCQSKYTPLYLECKEFIRLINAKKYSIDSAIFAKKISDLISKISGIKL